MATDEALQSGLDYVFGFFEKRHRLQSGKFDRDVRRPQVFSRIALAHSIFPDPASTIVVTGSKGKGTCARLIAAGLRQQGKRVGLVLTPEERHHLDRIRIDDVPIDAQDFLRLLEGFRSELDATATTSGEHYYHPPTAIFLLIALQYFRERNVAYVIVEGGRGARYDECGQIPAAIGVVTSILPEHLARLGPGMTELCEDKFSLMQSCGAVVCSGQAFAVASGVGMHLDQNRLMVVPVQRAESDSVPVPAPFPDPVLLRVPLPIVSLAAVDAPHAASTASLAMPIPAWFSVAQALATAALKGIGIEHAALATDPSLLASCQVIGSSQSTCLREGQMVFLDGAVSPDCLDFSYIRSASCAPRAIVLGMTGDKDLNRILEALTAHGFDEFFFFRPISASGHVSTPSVTSSWSGSFDTAEGFDNDSAQAILDLIAIHERIYAIGVQTFLRSFRNLLMPEQGLTNPYAARGDAALQLRSALLSPSEQYQARNQAYGETRSAMQGTRTK